MDIREGIHALAEAVHHALTLCHIKRLPAVKREAARTFPIWVVCMLSQVFLGIAARVHPLLRDVCLTPGDEAISSGEFEAALREWLVGQSHLARVHPIALVKYMFERETSFRVFGKPTAVDFRVDFCPLIGGFRGGERCSIDRKSE